VEGRKLCIQEGSYACNKRIIAGQRLSVFLSTIISHTYPVSEQRFGPFLCLMLSSFLL
jgi:hypothetical protein